MERERERERKRERERERERNREREEDWVREKERERGTRREREQIMTNKIDTHLFVKWNQQFKLGRFWQNSTENITKKSTEKYQSNENAWVIGFASGK